MSYQSINKLIWIVSLSCILNLNCSHGQVKSDPSLSAGQYYFRENGCVDIGLIFGKCGLPNYGVPDQRPIYDKSTAGNLELLDSQVKELREIYREYKSDVITAKKNDIPVENVELKFAKRISDAITPKQLEQWLWLSRRHAFFTGGPVNFLSDNRIREKLQIDVSQLDQIKSARDKKSMWLLEQINEVTKDAIEICLQDVKPDLREKVFDLLAMDEWEGNLIVGTPSAIAWFDATGNSVDYEKQAKFVQTTWVLRNDSQLACVYGSSYSHGLGNLARFYWYFKNGYANAEQKRIITDELNLIGIDLIQPAGRNIYDRNEEGEIPFLTSLADLLERTSSVATDRSFDKYLFRNLVFNIGIEGAVADSGLFDKEEVREVKRSIEANRQALLERCRTATRKVLKAFLAEQLEELSREQRKSLRGMLFDSDSGFDEIVPPLELLYFGLVANEQREVYSIGLKRFSGYQIPNLKDTPAGFPRVDDRPARTRR